jgi:Transglycosylase SLT domain
LGEVRRFGAFWMKRWLFLVSLAATAALQVGGPAQAQQRAQFEKLVAVHAKANLVPETLVHRVIVRESKYQPGLVGRGGTIGLMQIKLATARSVGYQGNAEGLRDPDTNLAFGVKYLAGAYRAANGDHDRAVHYYASGYYGAAKQQRLERELVKRAGPVLASAPPQDTAKPAQAAKREVTKPEAVAQPEEAAAKPKKPLRKKLADAGEHVPRPPADIPTGAHRAKPR